MKTLVMILSPFFAVSAMANLNVNLTRTTNNGMVAPAYQTSTTCIVSENAVSITRTGANARFAHPLEKQAVYTQNVPNQAVLESLANDAVRAPLVSFPGPIGGAYQTDSINLDNTNSVISAKSGSTIVKKNGSEAALKLEDFLNKNCD